MPQLLPTVVTLLARLAADQAVCVPSASLPLAVACRGRRHQLGLPVNGQKTGSNAKTARKFKRHIMYDVK